MVEVHGCALCEEKRGRRTMRLRTSLGENPLKRLRELRSRYRVLRYRGFVSVPCRPVSSRVVPCGLVVSSTDHAVMWIVSILAKMSPQNRYCAGVTSNGDRKTRTIQTFVGQRRRPENKVSPSGKVSGRKVCPEGQRGYLRGSEGGM